MSLGELTVQINKDLHGFRVIIDYLGNFPGL